jgi:starvation-inducible DNA-binding protein
MATPKFTVPSLKTQDAGEIIKHLEIRLASLMDTALTLKHIHWNVVGPYFISAHEMLDRHVEEVSLMVDAMAERIATLGGTPVGTPAHLVELRTWDDYAIGKATVPEHMAALDVVYSGLLEGHRETEEAIGEMDPVTQDLLISQLGQLELLQWFVRAHVESGAGEILTTSGTERGAAKKARDNFGT